MHHTRKKNTLMTVGALAFAAALMVPVNADKPDMATLIPEGALGGAWVNDLPAMKDGFNSSPFGKLLADPATEKAREAIIEWVRETLSAEGEEEEEFTKGFFQHWKGGAAMYARPRGEATETVDWENVSLVGIVGLDEEGQAWFRENYNPLREAQDIARDTYTVADVTVYRLKGMVEIEIPEDPWAAFMQDLDGLDSLDASPDDADTGPEVELEERTYQYAFVNDYLLNVEGDDQEIMREAIAGLKGADTFTSLRRSSLSGLPGDPGAAANSITLFFNVRRALTGVFEETTDNPFLPPDLNPRRVAEDSGLMDVRHVVFTVSGSEHSLDTSSFITHDPRRRGILGALLAGDGVDLKTLEYAPADALSVSVFALEVAPLYDAIVAIADSINPGISAMINMNILGIQSQYGVNPVDSILRNIGGEHAMVQRKMDPETSRRLSEEGIPVMDSQSFFFGLHNGEETAAALKLLLTNLQNDPNFQGMFTLEEREGVTIIQPEAQAMMGPMQLSAAFNKDAIVYTNNQVEMQEAIRGLTGNLAEKLSDDPTLQAAVAKADKQGLHAFTYSSQEGMTIWLDQIRDLFGGGMMFPMMMDFDPELIPSSEVARKYFGPSYSTLNVREGYIAMDATTLAPGVLE